MDDLDIGGIDEILKKAAKIRTDIKNGLQCNEVLPTNGGQYKCNGCGENNSWLSAWCFKCGLSKNAKPLNKKIGEKFTYKSVFDVDCNVYNTDQLLEDLQTNQAKKTTEKPREINSTRHSPRGELKIFEYNQDEKKKKSSISSELNKQVNINNVKQVVESAPSSDVESEFNIFSENDIILYDRSRRENKKPKKKLIIKPLSAPSLTQNSGSSSIKCAWEESSAKSPTKTSNFPIKVHRPHSMTNISPQKSSSNLPKRPSSACSRRAVFSTPSVFERLYNNESKIKNKTAQSSPQLLSDNVKLLKTSTVSLVSAPHLQ